MSEMKRLPVVIAAAVLIVLAAAFVVMMNRPAPEGPDLSRQKASEKGIYAVAVAPETEPLQQGPLHAWVLTLKTAAGEPVENATVIVGGGMPQHGHGLPTSPQATALGEGRYLIEGVRFNMGGWWVLEFAISAPAGEDKASFNVML